MHIWVGNVVVRRRRPSVVVVDVIHRHHHHHFYLLVAFLHVSVDWFGLVWLVSLQSMRMATNNTNIQKEVFHFRFFHGKWTNRNRVTCIWNNKNYNITSCIIARNVQHTLHIFRYVTHPLSLVQWSRTCIFISFNGAVIRFHLHFMFFLALLFFFFLLTRSNENSLNGGGFFFAAFSFHFHGFFNCSQNW